MVYVLNIKGQPIMPCKETKIRLLTEIREAESLNGISNSLYNGMD